MPKVEIVLTEDNAEVPSTLRGQAGVADFAQEASASVVQLTVEAVVVPSRSRGIAATAGPHLAVGERKQEVIVNMNESHSMPKLTVPSPCPL